ncbi:hypothetical protein VII00023_20742 [Vibrio ichthyoenteri ATCC 700023]|uniref:Uncharacterized protein n=1 Tax=Vibrio ichthyoenteri ATCC 700023 TaxID=870968 RepID=F9S7W1_9VIBR|nr:hypothetical protein VII00023_20742 [Vibrio ichthyoenteri ATCC 700023]
MTDIQFNQLIALLENFQLMVFIALCVVILGIGWFIGGQR